MRVITRSSTVTAARRQAASHLGRQRRRPAGVEHDVAAPAGEQGGVAGAALVGMAVGGERTVAVLPAVAVRARHDLAPVQRVDAVDGRPYVADAGGEHQAPRRRPRTGHRGEGEAAAVARHRLHPLVDDLDRRVRAELRTGEAAQLGGRRAVTGEEPVDGPGLVVAVAAAVVQHHPPPTSSQHQGGRQPRGAAADDHDLGSSIHGSPDRARRSVTVSGVARRRTRPSCRSRPDRGPAPTRPGATRRHR